LSSDNQLHLSKHHTLTPDDRRFEILMSYDPIIKFVPTIMVTAIVSPNKIQIPAGAVLVMQATWHDYQQLIKQRGDGSNPRIKYRQDSVLLMSPMAAHGRDANLLADIAKALLDHQGREYDSFTPITMELPEKSGIEPDYCFYIDNWPAVSGRHRIDWQHDPPPDLVIEVDVTSYSDITDYLPYKVPEIWLWKKQQLKIYLLQGEEYILQERSRFAPSIDLAAVMETAIKETYDRNSSFAIHKLQQRLISRNL
jgi:Uma2 family endonuclease